MDSTTKRGYAKPRQEALQKEINLLEADLNCLVTKRDVLGYEEGMDRKITGLRKKIAGKQRELKEKQQNAVRQKALRDKQRDQLLKIKESSGDVTFVREGSGRPRIEDDQQGLLNAIVDIVACSGSAADRRRSESLRSAHTLDELHDQLLSMGYELSRSATYLRLLPRSASSLEGRRHVKTVPVKLCRAQSDSHRDHPDQKFCRATINGLKQVASILGPKQVK